ncbi:MAG TPA: hypothetical protein GX707_11830 [Epulopiscium sp.]|nr:hypothetical protein [Candidatus Epulonipiscium sp.]
MSSRKEVQNHNIFEDTEAQKIPRYERDVQEAYATNEKMTIPKFENQVARDSGWRQMTDTR